jgi:hypothetical protein
MGDERSDCKDPDHRKGCRCRCCRPLVFVFIYFDPGHSREALDMVRDLAGQQMDDNEVADF